MTAGVGRERWLGAAMIAVAFGAGIATGVALPRRTDEGVRLTVTASDRIPRELERLGLSDEQRVAIRAILARGRPRVFTVLRDFEPRMRAALDSTEAEVAAVLDSTQRTRWQATRRSIQRDSIILRDRP